MYLARSYAFSASTNRLGTPINLATTDYIRPDRHTPPPDGAWNRGRPISVMLFIIAIDPLWRFLDCAANRGLLSPIDHREAKLHIFLYVGDAAIFFYPSSQDMQLIKEVLHVFIGGNRFGEQYAQE